ncbi:MAG: glycosyltransferase [Candidatus Pacearchaeota archaeon]|jgi:glycosyltransferase involved in cell wall biosynthesis
MIIFSSHRSVVNGKEYDWRGEFLKETLQNNKKDFIFIRHSMDGNLKSIVFKYKKGKLVSNENLKVFSKISVIRYISETLLTVLFIIINENGKDYVYIGINPLNALTGIILRKLKKVKKVIFYTPDYSPIRFKNKLLNKIYHIIDSFCVNNSDEVWNVSTRIYDVRAKMGLSKNKNKILPNIPSEEYKEFIENKKNKFRLVTLGKIGDQLDFINIFEAIKNLKNKYPKLTMEIIGNGPEENKYKELAKKMGLKNQIIFTGYLDHKKALKEISKSGIGLALYNGKWEFNYYGDSVKCREFFSFGLPVISTNTHSTVEDIKKFRAGIICKINAKEYQEALNNIFNNYEYYSHNSKKIHDKYKSVDLDLLDKLW